MGRRKMRKMRRVKIEKEEGEKMATLGKKQNGEQRQ